MGQSETQPDENRSRGSVRRKLAVAAILVLLLVALIVTPPLINVNRYSRRITTTISQSLGRPVHLDQVTLHFLPLPGLTLQNFVVSEDPAFGYEPVIRANKVVATLRASSLWRKQIEFSTIRFEMDENGSGPSVNLVRNAQGRWNLEQILMQAARVETAPTGQRKAGPRPRFPYIEATDARVNVKIGDEKKPYSLTDAEFSLWLPSPQEWRLRLSGKPTRTDSNVSDTGTLRLEGSLQRGSTITEVPVDLHASWRDAQLGEVSRLMSGEDAGWRGTLFLEANATGTLSKAIFNSHLQLNDLRRSELVPANPLDVTVDCSADSNALSGILNNSVCTVPVERAKPLRLTAATVDVSAPQAASAEVQVHSLPLSWIANWIKLFTSLLPNRSVPDGTVSGELQWNPTAEGWQGQLSAILPDKLSMKSPPEQRRGDQESVLNLDLDTAHAFDRADPAPWLKLQPVTLHLGPGSNVAVSGQADPTGYGLQLIGAGTTEQMQSLAKLMSPLGKGLEKTVAATSNTAKADAPHSVSLSCTRLWGGMQTCAPLAAPPAVKPLRPRHRRSK